MEIKSNGLTLKVGIDDDPLNPRKDYEHLGQLLCWHRRYCLGDDNPYEYPQKFIEDKELQAQIAVKIDVYLMDHGNLYLAHHNFLHVDPQCFDSGKVGIIYATKSVVEKEYGNLSDEALQKTRECLIQEIKEYDNYLNGSYYYFTIEGLEGECLDSCGSFSGNSMEDILKEMKENCILEYSRLFDKMIDKECHKNVNKNSNSNELELG